MSRLLSFPSKILFVLCFASIFFSTSCRPLRSLQQNTNTVAPRTLPEGAVFIEYDGLTLRHSQTLTAITPSHLAARAVGEFYLQVLAKAIYDHSLGVAEQSNIFYQLGPFTLSFVADTLEKVVPWDFVVGFAHQMVLWTNRGYVGTYDRAYWNDDRTLGIYAGLRLRSYPEE